MQDNHSRGESYSLVFIGISVSRVVSLVGKSMSKALNDSMRTKCMACMSECVANGSPSRRLLAPIEGTSQWCT